MNLPPTSSYLEGLCELALGDELVRRLEGLLELLEREDQGGCRWRIAGRIGVE